MIAYLDSSVVLRVILGQLNPFPLRSEPLRGPLHGIPVAVKDNIHTTNMPTTGGALAFEGFVPP